MNLKTVFLFIALFIPLYSARGDVTSATELLNTVTITENTSPEIKAAYKKLSESINVRNTLDTKYQSDLQENADAMKKTENSTANKLLGGTTMAATGIGGMQLMSGLAEKSADEDADADMTAYINTFSCSAAGTNIAFGETYELPAYSADFLNFVSEYKSLAADLAVRKNALGLPLGIESEEILDGTTLYDNEPAIINESVLDTASERLASGDADKKIQTGAITAGTGAIAGVVGNLTINKDAPKEKSAQIKTEYEKQQREIDKTIQSDKNSLTKLIDENKQKIADYNKLLQAHLEFIKTMTETECDEEFAEYVRYINGLTPITDDTTDMSAIKIDYDLDTQRVAYTKCSDAAAAARELAKRKADCDADDSKEWKNNECANKPIAVTENEDEAISSERAADKKSEEQIKCEKNIAKQWSDGKCLDSEYCPATGNGLSSINISTKIGDACKYGKVTQGRVYRKSSGVCSCTAISCENGYKVEGGMCVVDVNTASATIQDCATKYKSVFEEHIDAAKRENTISEYKKVVGDAPACEITKDKMKSICSAAGWETLRQQTQQLSFGSNWKQQSQNAQPIGPQLTPEQKCDNLYIMLGGNSAANTKVEKNKTAKEKTYTASELTYKTVCAKGNNKNNEHCVDWAGVAVLGGVQVGLRQGVGLATEYARVKKGKTIICNENFRNQSNDDFLACTSTDNKTFYEFRFDDLEETKDFAISENVQKTICELIYDGEYRPSGSTPDQGLGNGTIISGKSWPASCDLTEQACETANATYSKFGYGASYGYNTNRNIKSNTCNIKTNSTSSTSSLKTIDGIDNWKFINVQLELGSALTAQLKTYVTSELKSQGKTVSNFYCNDNYTSYFDFSGLTTKEQDVLSCFATYDNSGAHQIDFVFDDLSESKTINKNGGAQAMECMISGGNFTGKTCMFLTEEQCREIATSNQATCPECKAIYWGEDPSNPGNDTCLLPSARRTANFEKGVNIAGIAVAATAGVVITVATGGTGTAAVVFVTLETAGAVSEITSEIVIDQIGQDWLAKVDACKNATCAEELLKTGLTRIANFQNDFTDTEASAIDNALVYLINKIPTDSELYTTYKDSASLADNNRSWTDPNSWEPEQIWRAASIGLQLSSLFASLGKWLFKAGSNAVRFTKSTAALQKAFVKNSDDALKMTATQAKRLNEIDNALVKNADELAKSPSSRAAKELQTSQKSLTQEKNTILNKVGTKDVDEVAKLKSSAFDEKAITDAESELATARADLQKRLDWEKANPGAAKNDLQGRGSTGVTARNRVIAAENKLRDMGQTVPESSISTALPDGTKIHKSASILDSNSGIANDVAKKTSSSSTKTTRTSKVKISPDATPVNMNNGKIVIPAATFDDTAEAAVKGIDDIDSVADDIAEQATDSARTTPVSTADNITSQTDEITALKRKASDNFEAAEMIASGSNSGRSSPLLYSNLTDDEWTKLSAALSDDGLELQRSGDYMMLQKIETTADTAVPATRQTTSVASNVNETPRPVTIDESAARLPTDAEQMRATGIKNMDDIIDDADVILKKNPDGTYDAFDKSTQKSMKNLSQSDVDNLTSAVKKQGEDIVILDEQNKIVTDLDDAGRGARTAASTAGDTTAGTTGNVGDIYNKTRYGEVNISQADEDAILDAIMKKDAGNLSPEENVRVLEIMAKYVDNEQVARYANEMRENLINNLDIERYLDASSIEGKANAIIDALAPEYGLSDKGVRVITDNLPAGYADYSVINGAPTIRLNQSLGDVSQEQFIALITHELSHAIDDLAPELGVIGTKLNNYADLNSLYMSGNGGYKFVPTEIVAKKVGDIVSGTTDYGTNITAKESILKALSNSLK